MQQLPRRIGESIQAQEGLPVSGIRKQTLLSNDWAEIWRSIPDCENTEKDSGIRRKVNAPELIGQKRMLEVGRGEFGGRRLQQIMELIFGFLWILVSMFKKMGNC